MKHNPISTSLSRQKLRSLTKNWILQLPPPIQPMFDKSDIYTLKGLRGFNPTPMNLMVLVNLLVDRCSGESDDGIDVLVNLFVDLMVLVNLLVDLMVLVNLLVNLMVLVNLLVMRKDLVILVEVITVLLNLVM